jgi:hypothetical protein
MFCDGLQSEFSKSSEDESVAESTTPSQHESFSRLQRTPCHNVIQTSQSLAYPFFRIANTQDSITSFSQIKLHPKRTHQRSKVVTLGAFSVETPTQYIQHEVQG